MSTKIYEAFNIDASKWPKFILDAREKSTELLAKFLIGATPYINKEKMRDFYYHIPHNEYYAAMEDPHKSLGMKIFFIQETLERSAMDTTAWKMANDPQGYWVMDVEIWAWQYSARKIAFGVFRGDLDGLSEWIAEYPGVKNFSYWDSTDKDENVSTREWAARGRVWYHILGQPPMRVGMVDFVNHRNSGMAVDALLGVGYFKGSGGKLDEIYQEMYGVTIDEREPYVPKR